MDAEVFKTLKGWLGTDLFSTLALIGIVSSAIWVVYVFFAKSARDPAQKYYDLKLNLSVEAAKSVAQIATADKCETLRAAVIRFEELYWGELILIEDSKLESAMVEFRGLIAPGGELDIEQLVSRRPDPAKLRGGALKVSRAAFNLLQPSWFDQVRATFRTAQKS